MKTRAVRLYGKNDLRLEEFELPEIKDDEILAKVVCDSICMSSYKSTHEADVHKRVPRNIAEHPTMIGHEFSGELIKIGAKWKDKFSPGDKYSIQPALNYEGGPVGVLSAPGYSYEYIGGDATYIIIPREVIELDCVLKYTGEGYYPASLSEPLSCVIGAVHANYHTSPGSYIHKMDIVEGGAMAVLAGAGPMGLAAIDYVLHRELKPSLMIVTDIDQARLDRAAFLCPVEEAARRGIDLKYINTSEMTDVVAGLRALTGDKGYNDVFVFAPVAPVVEQADAILSHDGCLNFFAGPANPDFRASLNFYNVHYAATHITATSGGNTSDMIEALDLMSKGLNPSGLVTHIGGLDAVIDTTMRLPEIPGGKKLIYTHLDMPLTAITEFAQKGETNPVFKKLHEICEAHKGLWSIEAENYLLANAGLLTK